MDNPYTRQRQREEELAQQEWQKANNATTDSQARLHRDSAQYHDRRALQLSHQEENWDRTHR